MPACCGVRCAMDSCAPEWQIRNMESNEARRCALAEAARGMQWKSDDVVPYTAEVFGCSFLAELMSMFAWHEPPGAPAVSRPTSTRN